MLTAVIVGAFLALFSGGILEMAPERLIYSELIDILKKDLPREDKKKVKKFHKEFNNFTEEYETGHIKRGKQFWNIDAQFESDINDFDQIFYTHKELQKEMIDDFLDSRDLIKGYVTAEQWSAAYSKIERYEKKVWKKQTKGHE
jgi:hypothetical protein